MGSSTTQGELWGAAARDWAELQEPQHKPVWQAMLNAAKVGQGARFFDAGCGGAEALIAIAHKRVPQGDFSRGRLGSTAL
jgi:hypothetical protein